ncbi:MAG: translocation/assembly module TamB domain-containing protein, partial [Vicingaceae bacterium]
DIDITAVYRLRARLADLLVDSSDVYRKRVPVDLKLKMQNKMMNPDISFDIDLPTADADTKGKVRGVLYVSDQEENIQELNKQVFSLLVLNSFMPPAGSDPLYGRAGVGSTTSSELLSNQLS